MMRRNWIKLFVDQSLRGTMMVELKPAERWVWIGFLLLCGDSPIEGQISVTQSMGYTDGQLAALLACDEKTITSAKSAMVEHQKIDVDMFGVIKILKWGRYQSEYQRQKKYRGAERPVFGEKNGSPKERGGGDAQRLQGKVTPSGDVLDIDKDKERDKDKEKEKKQQKKEKEKPKTTARTTRYFLKKSPTEKNINLDLTDHKTLIACCAEIDKAITDDDIEMEFNEMWLAWRSHVGAAAVGHKGDALAAYRALRRRVYEAVLSRAFSGYFDFLSHKKINENFKQTPMYVTTFLRKFRWFTYINFKFQPRL